MTEEERSAKIVETVWYWLPARWLEGVDWFEITRVIPTGTVEDGGVDIYVKKNEADPTIVSFTNAEVYGDAMLSPDAARARVVAG